MTFDGYTGALDRFADETTFPGAAFEALVSLGDAHLGAGGMQNADEVYGRANLKARNSQERFRVAHARAVLALYMGDLERMGREIETCIKAAPADDAMNDLLTMRMIGMRSASGSDKCSYGAYVAGLAAIAQSDTAAAADSLTRAAADTTSLVASRATAMLGDFARERGDAEEAMSLYERAAVAAADTTVRVELLVRAADTARDDPAHLDRAMELYRQVLASYPGSLYDAEARRKLREVMAQ